MASIIPNEKSKVLASSNVLAINEPSLEVLIQSQYAKDIPRKQCQGDNSERVVKETRMLHLGRNTITSIKSGRTSIAKISKICIVFTFFYLLHLFCFLNSNVINYHYMITVDNSIGSNILPLSSDDNRTLKKAKTFGNNSKKSCSNIDYVSHSEYYLYTTFRMFSFDIPFMN